MPGFVPAHRVVNRNGMLTGKHHFGNSSTMQQLLENEGFTVQNDMVMEFGERFTGSPLNSDRPGSVSLCDIT
ncbi:MAG: MGMT family protein [Marinilabiliales bacterium]|nr:MGMT family protein [Marinilabiliales bacterium]